MFIVFEGSDCCGKTEQAELLAARILRTSSQSVQWLEFPTTRLGGYAARKTLEANLPWKSVSHDGLLMLPALLRQCTMLADRYSVVPEIRRVLQQGGMFIASRWTPSGLVYGEMDGIDPNWISATQAMLPEADLYFLLDIEAEESMHRCKERGRPSEVYENLTFQQGVVKRYRDLFQRQRAIRDGSRRWFVIDGLQSRVKVHEDVFNIVRATLIERGF